MVSLALVAGACGGADRAAEPIDEPAPTAPPTPTQIPSFSWTVGTPSEAGFDGNALLAGLAALEAQDSNAHRLIVARDGRLVIDAALWPSSAGELHDLASVTKSVVALVVGAAIERGDLASMDVTLGEILDGAVGMPVAGVSLRNLLGMRTGLDCSAEDGEAELQAMGQSSDYVAFATALPSVGPPGETFAYCSPGYHLVSAAMTAVTGRSLVDYAAEVLFEPLGIEEWAWPADPQGVTRGWGDLELDPLDVARIGQLILGDGRWGESQLLPTGFVAELASATPTADPTLDYGLGWWLPTDRLDGALEGRGRGGQELFVWPEQDLVVVVAGAETDGRLIVHTLAGALLAEPRLDAAVDAEIADRFAALTLAPPPGASSEPDASVAPGSSFELESNQFGIDAVRVAQGVDDEVTVDLSLGDEVFELAVGLDGVARLAERSPTGAPVALAGTWSGTVLTVDYEEAFGPNHWTIAFDLGPRFTMTVTDLAGRFPPTVVAGSPGP